MHNGGVLLSILSLLGFVSSLGVYRPYTYQNYYGSTSPYGQRYPQQYSYTSLAKVPLCKTGYTKLEVFVTDGTVKVASARINYVDSNKLNMVVTDQHGFKSIQIKGCSVGLIIYHNADNPVYRNVDLSSCTSRVENVVIDISEKCDFVVEYSFMGLMANMAMCMDCGLDNQIVSYLYQSAEHTGHKQVGSGSVCVNAGDMGQNFKMIATSQYGTVFNVLDITILMNDNRRGVMALPPKVDLPYDILFISNTYESGGETNVLNDILAWKFESEAMETVKNTDGMGIVLNDIFSGAVAVDRFDEFTEKKWAFGISFLINALNVDLEGNIVLMDMNGNYQTVEHPNAGIDYDGTFFFVGCFCKNVPSLAPGDFVKVGTYVADIVGATICDTPCGV